MRIDFDDEEYPELSRYLSDPKRKMKFLYFLEEMFENNSFDPVKDGLKPISFVNPGTQAHAETSDSELHQLLTGITDAIGNLSKNMEGSVIGRFPTEHVVHEVHDVPKTVPTKLPVDDNDYSSTEGIDFTQAIAMFED